MKRTEAWFSVLACLVLLLSACQFLTVLPLPGSTVGPAETQTDPPAPEASMPAPALAPVLAAKTDQEESESPKYTIEARWPYLEWDADPRVAAFNQAAEDFVRGEIRSFKEGVYSLPDDPLFRESFSMLQIDFQPTSSTQGILGVLFQISFYTAGAAHPGHYSHAINYDLRAGRVMALEDIFRDGSGFLETISSTCIADLQARSVLEWEDGALPRMENYQVWNITPQGILITFDEYQVASYAAGPQTVIVPYEKLQPMLRPDGPLAGYIQP